MGGGEWELRIFPHLGRSGRFTTSSSRLQRLLKRRLNDNSDKHLPSKRFWQDSYHLHGRESDAPISVSRGIQRLSKPPQENRNWQNKPRQFPRDVTLFLASRVKFPCSVLSRSTFYSSASLPLPLSSWRHPSVIGAFFHPPLHECVNSSECVGFSPIMVTLVVRFWRHLTTRAPLTKPRWRMKEVLIAGGFRSDFDPSPIL